MKIMKTALLLGALGIMGGSVQAATTSPKVYLNGTVEQSVKPIMKNGSTLVPLKAVGQLLGATTEWNGATKQVKVTRGDTINTLTINEKVAQKQEGIAVSTVTLTTPAIIENGTTYVPLRYLAESLDVKVEWLNQSVYLEECIGYQDKNVYLGSNLEEIEALYGTPDLVLSDGEYDLKFYTQDADETMIFYMKDDQLTGFCTNASSFEFRNYTYGASAEVNDYKVITIEDTKENNQIVALGYNINGSNKNTHPDQYLQANERMIVALTNGFRAKDNVAPLAYNETVSAIARAHSEDMAANKYFSHTNLQGLGPDARLTNGGIKWSRCGENIAAGNGSGLKTFGQWLNSAGHRQNMLEQIGDIGVGGAYDSDSTYRYYYTQKFALIKYSTFPA